MTFPSPTYQTLTVIDGIVYTEWTTATRPSSPVTGITGFNSDINALETWNGSTWVAAGGGGGTPGGSNGQVQYNNLGSFGGLTNTALTAMIAAFGTSTSGAVPASGGGTTNFLRADGTFAAPGGAGSPGGSNGQVQYNNSGSFGGLTNTQLTTLINNATRSLSGAVPAPGGAGTSRYLREDLTFAIPSPASSSALPNVVDTYGADPSGVADSTTAFTNACASGTGVLVPSGIYKLTATIPLTGATYLIGLGPETSVINMVSTTAAVFSLANGVSNCGISGMRITRTGIPVSGADGIVTASTGAFDHVETIYFQNLKIDGHWHALNLGPTSNSNIKRVTAQFCYSDVVIMTNTVGSSSVPSTPLQWELDDMLLQLSNGRALFVNGVSQLLGVGAATAVGAWNMVQTFACTGGGVFVVGTPSCCISGIRMSGNCFFGGDGTTEVYLDCWGPNHIIDCDIELAGQTNTGVSYSVPPSNVGYGIFVSYNNSGVTIRANINGCSYDGIYSVPNLYGAFTAPTVLLGCYITNNGQGGSAGNWSGLNTGVVSADPNFSSRAGVGGGNVIVGGFIGQWNINPPFYSGHQQHYGLNVGTDNIKSIGCVYLHNFTAPVSLGVTLTVANSFLDALAGGGSQAVWSTGTRPTSIPVGTTGFNTGTGSLETWNGSAWVTPTGGSGTVTSVNVSGGSTGFTFSGGPVTGSGTIGMAGVISSLSLPIATTGAIGAVRPDGTSILINPSTGVISAAGGGGGTVTEIDTGTGLIGGPVTGKGVIAFDNIGARTILANPTGGSAQPVGTNLSVFLDDVYGSTTGQILMRFSGGWAGLAPAGTVGLLLTNESSGGAPSWTVDHIGSNTNDTASSGYVGEAIASSVPSGSAISITSGVTTAITSFLLPAGDWDVQGSVGLVPAGSTTILQFIGGVNAGAIAFPTDPGGGMKFVFQNAGGITTGGVLELPTGTGRLSLASATTVYLVVDCGFISGTCAAFGFLWARRTR